MRNYEQQASREAMTPNFDRAYWVNGHNILQINHIYALLYFIALYKQKHVINNTLVTMKGKL